MNVAELRYHVAVDHRQGHTAYEGDNDTVITWHDQWEHRPGPTTHLGHAHDEISARRHKVRLEAS